MRLDNRISRCSAIKPSWKVPISFISFHPANWFWDLFSLLSIAKSSRNWFIGSETKRARLRSCFECANEIQSHDRPGRTGPGLGAWKSSCTRFTKIEIDIDRFPLRTRPSNSQVRAGILKSFVEARLANKASNFWFYHELGLEIRFLANRSRASLAGYRYRWHGSSLGGGILKMRNRLLFVQTVRPPPWDRLPVSSDSS